MLLIHVFILTGEICIGNCDDCTHPYSFSIYPGKRQTLQSSKSRIITIEFIGPFLIYICTFNTAALQSNQLWTRISVQDLWRYHDVIMISTTMDMLMASHIWMTLIMIILTFLDRSQMHLCKTLLVIWFKKRKLRISKNMFCWLMQPAVNMYLNKQF